MNSENTNQDQKKDARSGFRLRSDLKAELKRVSRITGIPMTRIAEDALTERLNAMKANLASSPQTESSPSADRSGTRTKKPTRNRRN